MSTQYIPERFGWYRHQDGGLYQVLQIAKSTVDQSVQIVYNHEYPFEPGVWVRPAEEWTHERFTSIPDAEAEFTMLLTDRETMQGQIIANKAERRAREAAVAVCDWCHGQNFRTVTDNTKHTYDCKCVK